MSRTDIEVVGRTIAAEARMLARVATGGERAAALAIARALSDPQRVLALVEFSDATPVEDPHAA